MPATSTAACGFAARATALPPGPPARTTPRTPPGPRPRRQRARSVRDTSNMRQIQVGNISETVVERADYPPEKLRDVLGKETVTVLGYGVQGRGQSLNMKDNGVSVIVGQREKTRSWDLAVEDGWLPGKTLFPLEEAARRGTVVQYLLSDAGQKDFWPTLKPILTAGKAIYFSHGFSLA